MPSINLSQQMDAPIHVTRTFLPPLEEYTNKISSIWESHQLTNNGPLVRELEERVAEYLKITRGHLLLVSNGTVALQLALRALECRGGEVITTPFSYVATTSSILWENCTPIFADIDPESLCIDPKEVIKKISPKTRAIMPTHVYGRPCDNVALERIAREYDLKIIYDGSHAFGVQKNDECILSWGDISTLSFHATKLFHTAEGGALIARDPEVIERLKLLRAFGHRGDDYRCLGINAKMSELNAAMGLCVLPYMEYISKQRKLLFEEYDAFFKNHKVASPVMKKKSDSLVMNYAYYPILFDDEALLVNTVKKLKKNNIFPRRYFTPSLNTLPYLDSMSCPVSESISSRILCLPTGSNAKESVVRALMG